MSAARRFVLLRHEGYGALHFDLMIEDGAALATWQFEFSPVLLAPGGSFACRRLAQHRTAYLDYAGPVSGDRGSVHRTDHGTCDVIANTNSRWELEFAGAALHGRFVLKRTGDTTFWILTHN